jgi:hypothetical protein
MKTSLELPNELSLAMREQAAQEGRKFSEVVEETIRRGLSLRPQPSCLKQPQAAGQGIEFPLFPCAPGAPASGLTLAELISLEQLSLTNRGKANILPWRRKLLSESGFKFHLQEINPAMEWEEGLARLRQFKVRFGHCDVPARWSEDMHLGGWVSRLRIIKKTLPKEGIKQLTELGLDWNPLGNAWEENFKQLKAFKEQHGHCRVPDKTSPLGIWVANVRHRKERHSQTHIRKLDLLGFDWNPIETQWQTQYDNFLAFKRRFGHARVPTHWAEDPELNRWVVTQRVTKNKMPQERIEMLERAGFEWSPHETQWMAYYEQLKGYLLRHGPENPPGARSPLGNWMGRQRQRRAQLPEHHRKLLEKIGFVWTNRPHTAWMKRYEELKTYKEKHGHCSPPTGQSSLGRWVATQRSSKAKMSEDRRKLLDKIGFVWSPLAR